MVFRRSGVSSRGSEPQRDGPPAVGAWGGPNANVFTAGSAAFRAYDSRNPETIALVQRYGGWIDPGSAGYARQTEIARQMLAGEIDPHFEPNDFSGRTVAEQLLWGGASGGSVNIVRMALEQVDWPADDPRSFWKLFRPLHNIEDYKCEQKLECLECFQVILARCGPHRCRRPPRSTGQAAEEHPPRLGVPMGTGGVGDIVSLPRRRSRRSGRGTMGNPSRMG